MSNLVGHQALSVDPGNGVQDAVASVSVPPIVLLPSGGADAPVTLATCHLTRVVPNIVGGIATIFISSYIQNGQAHENVQLVHLHESGISQVTFTLVGNNAQASGVGLVFSGL